MHEHWITILRCPKCAPKGGGRLIATADGDLRCTEPSCERLYPVENGIPVMLTEDGDFLGYRRSVLAKRQSGGRR